jgi:hypothetical protein
MDKKRTVLIAAALFVVVLLALGIGHMLSPPAATADEIQFESRCMAALNEWQLKKVAKTQLFTDCEQHFANKGNGMQASFFGQARVQTAGKTDQQLHLEAQCVAALDEWRTKRAARTPLFAECETYYGGLGNAAQAGIFRTAKIQSGGK